jgi:hypothetical protein
MRPWCLAVLLVLVTAGCAPTAQQHAQEVGSATDDAAVAFSTCLKEIRERPIYASLAVHTTDLDSGSPNIAQLTDETIPSIQDAQLLGARFDATNSCRGNFLNALATARPDLVPVFEDAFTKREAVVVILVERKVSWGEGARRTKVLASDMQQKIANANRQWVADVAAHRADIAQRQAASTALMHWSTQQQMFNAISSR